MATRMQQRRGTASQWTAANPTLAAGEIGFETDTNKFKMGNGATAWTALDYFANATELAAAIDAVVGIAPETLDTLAELAAAIGDDADFFTNIATDIDDSITVHNQATSGVHGINNTYALVTLAGEQNLSNKTLVSPIISSPTGITKSDVGLANVDNTTDANKPVSTATQTALDLKAPLESPIFTGTVSGITKDMVGLANVDNTTDADKPVSTATQAALDLKAPLESPIFTGTVSGITKGMVGLGSVDDTSDLSKPVSNATGVALDQKLSLAGGTLEGFLTTHANPTDALHVANKRYVDAVAEGLNVHASSRVATTTNIDLSNALEAGDTIDGVTLVAGNRVLVRAQSTASQNGIYVVQASGAAVRALDFDAPAEIVPGDFTFVSEGTTYGNSGWVQTATVAIVGTDPIAFTQFSGAGTYVAGNGLSLNGTSFSADLTVLAPLESPNFTGTVTGVTKAHVSLGNVDNTSDANKPVSTATQAQLDLKAPKANPTFTGTVSGVTKGHVGLANVDNTSDALKPVSTATQVQLDLKAPKANPTFTGLVSVSGSGVAFSDGTQTKEGVPSRTEIISRATSYTFSSLSERDTLLEMNSASPTTVTIPLNATVGYPIGSSIDILQTGAGQVTIVGAAGVTVNATPGLKLRTQWSSATLMKRATNSWVVVGDLTA